MLYALFGTELRTRILNLILLYPENKYTAGQLAVALDWPISSIRRELENLAKIGIINEEKPGDNGKKRPTSNFFSAAQNFLLYPEIKALFTKAQILSSRKFLDDFQKVCQPKFLALTGVFTNYPEAQTDILVVGAIRRGAFLDLIRDLEKDLGREINFTILSEKEFNYRREIMDIFLYKVLEGKTIVLLDKNI